MSAFEFRSFPFRSFSKENSMGTDGINEILMPVLLNSVHSRTAGNAREQTGMNALAKHLVSTPGVVYP